MPLLALQLYQIQENQIKIIIISMSQVIVDDKLPELQSVKEFLAQFFKNHEDSPASDDQFIKSAKECGLDTARWQNFIGENISLADRKLFRVSLNQWIAQFTKGRPQEQDVSYVLKAYLQVSSTLLKFTDLREPRRFYQPLRQLDQQIKKSIEKSINSSTFGLFLSSQLNNIVKILGNKTSLLSYFEEIKLLISETKDGQLVLGKLFKEMTFTDFLILLQLSTQQSQKLNKYLFFEQAVQTPTLYEVPPKLHSSEIFVKFISDLIKNQQYVLIFNAGSQLTTRSGKTSFLTKLVELDDRYIEGSSFSNTLNLYSKFKLSQKNNLILADFNGFITQNILSQVGKDKQIVKAQNNIQKFVQLSSVLLLHVREEDLSQENNILQQGLYVQLLQRQNWEKIIIFVRDFQTQTEKKLKSRIPSSLKGKIQLCCLPNFQNPPKGLKTSQISGLQIRAINTFRKAIQSIRKIENKTNEQEEAMRKKLKSIFDTNRLSFEQSVQKICQSIVKEHKQWSFQINFDKKKASSIFYKLQIECEKQQQSIFVKFKALAKGLYKLPSDLDSYHNEITKIVKKILIKYSITCRKKIQIENIYYKQKVERIYNQLQDKALYKKNVDKKSDKQSIEDYQKNIKFELNRFIEEKIKETTIKDSELIDPKIFKNQYPQLQKSLNFYRRIVKGTLLEWLLPRQLYEQAARKKKLLALEEVLTHQLELLLSELRLIVLQNVIDLKDLHSSIVLLIQESSRFVDDLKNIILELIGSEFKNDSQEELKEILQSYMTGALLQISRSQIQLRRISQYQAAINYFKTQLAIKQMSLTSKLTHNIAQIPADQNTKEIAVKKILALFETQALKLAQEQIKYVLMKQMDHLNPQKMLDILQEELAIPPNATKQELKKVYKNYYKYLKNQNRYLFELMCKQIFIALRKDNLEGIKQRIKDQYQLNINILESNDDQKILKIIDEAKVKMGGTQDQQKKNRQGENLLKYVQEILPIMKKQIEKMPSKYVPFYDQKIFLLIDNCVKNDLKNKAIGCDQQCPFCGVKCILQKGHNGDHKTREKSHLLTAFAGVSLTMDNQFSLFICQSAVHMRKRIICKPTKDSKKEYVKNAKRLVAQKQDYLLWNNVIPYEFQDNLFQSNDKLEYYKMIWANVQAVMIKNKYLAIIPNIKQSSDPDILKYKQENNYLTSADLEEFEVDPLTEEEYRLIDFGKDQ